MPRNSCPNVLALIRRSADLRKLRLLVAVLLAFAVTGFLSQVALAAAGDLDPTFGVGGKRTTDYFGADDVGSAVAVQPDGKVVVAAVALTPAVSAILALRDITPMARQTRASALAAKPQPISSATLTSLLASRFNRRTAKLL